MTTTVIRERCGSSVSPTARLSMLNPREANIPETCASTPGWFCTSAERTCRIRPVPDWPVPVPDAIATRPPLPTADRADRRRRPDREARNCTAAGARPQEADGRRPGPSDATADPPGAVGIRPAPARRMRSRPLASARSAAMRVLKSGGSRRESRAAPGKPGGSRRAAPAGFSRLGPDQGRAVQGDRRGSCRRG